MPALRKSRHSVEDQVRAELSDLRSHVPGIRGSLVATRDGLVVLASETGVLADLAPESVERKTRLEPAACS